MNFKVSKKNVGNMDNQNICMINRFSLKNCDSYLRKKISQIKTTLLS